MKSWLLLGTGLLLITAMKGCTQTEQPSASLPNKQPIEVLNRTQASPISTNLEFSSLKKSDKSSIPPSTSENTKVNLSSPKFSTPSRPSNLGEEQKISSLPIDLISSQSIKNSNLTHASNEHDPAPPVTQSNFTDIHNEQEVQKQNTKDQLNYLSKPFPTAQNTTQKYRDDDTDAVPVTLEVPKLTGLGKVAGEQRSSGKCDLPWELDLAGNICGNRASSERPNTNVENVLTQPTYVNPGTIFRPFVHHDSVRQPTYLAPLSNHGATSVRGYVRRDGTYVRPHFRRKR